MRNLYVGLAGVAALLVWLTNDAINTFLGKSSTMGAIVLFAMLPCLAILTRPVVVAAQRGHTQRAIGIIYAIRSVRLGFFVKSIVLWLVFTTFVLTLIGVLYREAEMQAAAGVSNWWYLTNLFVLIAHLIPGRFRLPAAPPVTFLVSGPKRSGKSSFIGLLPLEEMPNDWTVMPSENARRLLLSLHGRAREETEVDATDGARLTFLRPRIWSTYAGTRPTPVDFVELSQIGPRSLPAEAPGRVGIVILIPATGGIMAELHRQLAAIRAIRALTTAGGKIAPPVAVVLTKIDLVPNAQVSPDAVQALDENCRKWKGFSASDRGGEASDVEGFSPKGYMAAALWLLDEVT